MGIDRLAAVAVNARLDVLVAAPHTEYSGSSASLTAVEAEGRLVLTNADRPATPAPSAGSG
jgi:5'-nucleotidase